MILMTFAAAMASCSRPGHADELPAPEKDVASATERDQTRSAVFAGGCFWCTEAVFEQLDGVKDVVAGYAGGTKETADYEKVSTGGTRHAEAIRITYDPSKITFGKLLQVFFATHDPTTKDRQGPDTGPQYRSAIFYDGEEQKSVAEAYIKQLTDAKAFEEPIVTTVESLEEFYLAEDYHQDFVQRNPNQGYVRAIAVPKVLKVQKQFKTLLKPTSRPAAE